MAQTNIQLYNQLLKLYYSHVNLGVYYCNERAHKRDIFDRALQHTLMEIAKLFDSLFLATALVDAFQNLSDTQVPEVVRSQQPSRRSIFIPPRMYQKVMQMVISRIDT